MTGLSQKTLARLFIAPDPTVRVWLFLCLWFSREHTITTTATGIAEAMRKHRPVSRPAVSEALKTLSELEIIKVQRVGKALVLRQPSEVRAAA